jgi:hypothetical protein
VIKQESADENCEGTMIISSSIFPLRTLRAGLCIAAVFFALTQDTEAQKSEKVFRIGYLSAFTPARDATRAGEIRSALRELGYVEGQNIAIEYRYADGNQNRFPELAAFEANCCSVSRPALLVQ